MRGQHIALNAHKKKEAGFLQPLLKFSAVPAIALWATAGPCLDGRIFISCTPKDTFRGFLDSQVPNQRQCLANEEIYYERSPQHKFALSLPPQTKDTV